MSETENPDLFWGLRGGGGNFGIVTSFELRLHPIGPTVLAGLMAHPIESAKDVARQYRDLVQSAPEELVTALAVLMAPPAPFVPAELHGKPIHALTDEAIDAYLDAGIQTHAPTTHAVMFRHGGAVARVPDDATAASHRGAAYMAHPVPCWQDPADDDRNTAWCRRFSAAMAP